MKFDTEYGKAAISKNVFARIAADAVARFSDRMLLATPKGKAVRVGSTGKELLEFIEVEDHTNPDELGVHDVPTVDFHIFAIIRTGCDAVQVAGALGRIIRHDVPLITGVDVGKVIVIILGEKSKSHKEITKQFMEVSC